MEISPTSLGNLCWLPVTLTINKKRFQMFGGNLPHTNRCPSHPPLPPYPPFLSLTPPPHPRSAPVARFSLPSPQTGPGRSGYEARAHNGRRTRAGPRLWGAPSRPRPPPPPPPAPPPQRPPRPRRLTAPLPGQRGKEAEARPGRGGGGKAGREGCWRHSSKRRRDSCLPALFGKFLERPGQS